MTQADKIKTLDNKIKQIKLTIMLTEKQLKSLDPHLANWKNSNI